MSIQLIIENFRCFSNTQLTLPITGCILLSGSSGAGKSSIFKSIFWCLYGEEKKIVKYGCKRAKVEFIFNDIHVIRLSNPNSLNVNYKGKQYEKDAAQEIIYKYFGKDFLQTSYISQKHVKNFFALSNADKCIFLQECSLQNFNIKELKDKVKSDCKERSNNLNKLQTELTTLKRYYPNITSEPIKPDQPIKFKESYEKEKQERVFNQEKLKELRDKLNTLQTMQYNFIDYNSKLSL